ncbi:hypothetical protein ACIQUG_09165 [Ensifer sp. NPDC090286]|uniref:hypothetical protein n=1 Tax=Ensifer sp. NPDC090286 TaxID=3363991 RepID=UPI00383ABA58
MATVKLMDLSVSAWSAAANKASALIIRSLPHPAATVPAGTVPIVLGNPERKTAYALLLELPVCLSQFRTQNRCALLLELLCLSQFRTQNRCALLLELL